MRCESNLNHHSKFYKFLTQINLGLSLTIISTFLTSKIASSFCLELHIIKGETIFVPNLNFPYISPYPELNPSYLALYSFHCSGTTSPHAAL